MAHNSIPGLVNSPKKRMEKHRHAINGWVAIHYFEWAMASSSQTVSHVYQAG